MSRDPGCRTPRGRHGSESCSVFVGPYAVDVAHCHVPQGGQRVGVHRCPTASVQPAAEMELQLRLQLEVLALQRPSRSVGWVVAVPGQRMRDACPTNCANTESLSGPVVSIACRPGSLPSGHGPSLVVELRDDDALRGCGTQYGFSPMPSHRGKSNGRPRGSSSRSATV